MGSGKPRGINAARKLRTVRRQNRWAQKAYKKAHLGTQFKCNPFGGSSHCKGIVLEKIGIEAKQPNSAIRKCVRAQLIKNGKKIAAFVPRDGCLNFIDENVSDIRPRISIPSKTILCWVQNTFSLANDDASLGLTSAHTV